MIVVGLLGGADELAVEVARRAAGTGARVEMVGAAIAGPAGDLRLLELGAAGIGYATVIRSGADSLDPADLDLALRYLPDVRAVVLVRPPGRLLATAIDVADWAGAALVLVGPLDAETLAAVDAAGSRAAARAGAAGTAAAGVLVLDPPGADPEGTFAGFVAALAIRLDAGDPPEVAFRATAAALAVDPA